MTRNMIETTSVSAKRTVKQVRRIHQSSEIHWVGDGFPVRSVFDYNSLGRELTPFLLLDYAAPYEFTSSDRKRGVGAHPHKGFETVTIAYQGELEHRDSSGGGGKIGPGDVQWMTAGQGIVHEEFHSGEFTRKGGKFQVIQLWVNLPAKFKGAKPGYQTLLKAQIPTLELPQEAGSLRVIAGEYDSHKGPAKTFTPINLWDVQMRDGKEIEMAVPSGHTTALLLMKGCLAVNSGHEAREGDLVIFEKSGEDIHLEGKTDSHFLILSGEPIDEPIVGAGPFVMNTRTEIEKAFQDYQKGLLGEL
jgi:quercetin 2,3-dioxygenase